MIERKTAVLFAAATRLGGDARRAPTPRSSRTCADYGMNLGMAFQIADDVLDYTADADALGKNLGDDLAEGKATLPLIHAMAQADAGARASAWRRSFRDCDTAAMPEVLAAIRASGSLEYSRRVAERYAQAAEDALDSLPPMSGRPRLRGLARYSIDRGY